MHEQIYREADSGYTMRPEGEIADIFVAADVADYIFKFIAVRHITYYLKQIIQRQGRRDHQDNAEQPEQNFYNGRGAR